MDDFKKRVDAARACSFKIGNIEFRYRMPSRLYVYAAGDREGEHFLEANHRLLLAHVIDWSGATESDVLEGCDETRLVPFAKWAFDEWASEHIKEASELLSEIMIRFRERLDAREASLKN